MMELFYENTKAKSFIINVWHCFKYNPEVVQDSKINTKMLKKTVHLFNVDFAEDIST